MTPPVVCRPLLASGAALLVPLALALGGCSGEEGEGAAAGAPEDASLGDYCDSYTALYDEVLTEAASGDSAAMVRAFQAWVADLQEVGTPAEMPDEARTGFELFVDQADEIDEDATMADLERLVDELSESDQAAGEALSEWTLANCPLEIPELPEQ